MLLNQPNINHFGFRFVYIIKATIVQNINEKKKHTITSRLNRLKSDLLKKRAVIKIGYKI